MYVTVIKNHQKSDKICKKSAFSLFRILRLIVWFYSGCSGARDGVSPSIPTHWKTLQKSTFQTWSSIPENISSQLQQTQMLEQIYDDKQKFTHFGFRFPVNQGFRLALVNLARGITFILYMFSKIISNTFSFLFREIVCLEKQLSIFLVTGSTPNSIWNLNNHT